MIHRGRNGEERWRTEKLSFPLLPPPHTRLGFLGAHAGARFESSSVVAVFRTHPAELVVGGARGRGARKLFLFASSPGETRETWAARSSKGREGGERPFHA